MRNIIELTLAKQTLSKADLAVLESYEPKENQNLLYFFFTPIWLCKIMYKLAVRYGCKNGVP